MPSLMSYCGGHLSRRFMRSNQNARPSANSRLPVTRLSRITGRRQARRTAARHPAMTWGNAMRELTLKAECERG